MREKTIKERIIEAISDGINLMRKPEFRTDLGQRVLIGRQKVDPETEIPCVVLWPQSETAILEPYGCYSRTFELKIDGLAKQDTNVEDMMGDIFEAVSSTRITWVKSLRYTGGGVARYPEAGESIVGVNLSFEIVYQTSLKRADMV